MAPPSERPDPDVLLKRVQADAARSQRGKHRVFVGFAPGVGKTYRMLQVARDLVAEQELDVVIGIVETHRRRETAALTLGLEMLARRTIEYRGRTLEELDLDAALARRPRVLLVDELAHTNAPGCRHAKRWQDVEEVLAAGIDVLSTVNIQHLESLNDVVAQITRVQVRETVPDVVLDRADSVELVDIAPEELLERLREGKVYLPGEAQRAAEHFFQRGNLLALRELALRRIAQHVDDDVQDYREQHGVAATWPAGERILVCVGPAPSSAQLIRAAARLAAGLRCPWVAAYVESSAAAGLGPADRERLEVHLRLAESLGASVARLTESRVSRAILSFARRHNVTRIVIGKPTHAQFRDLWGGSLLDEVVRGSGDIDVYVTRGDGTRDPVAPTPTARPKRAPLMSYVAAAALVLVTLGVALAIRSSLALPDTEMLFLLAVMVTAVAFGRGPALLAAALGVACYDYYFVPPVHTFSVADRAYFLTFAMMFALGTVMSELTARIRRQERDAHAREERTAALYALTKDLAALETAPRIAEVAARHAAEVFQAGAVVLHVGDQGELAVAGAAPDGTTLEAAERGVARWALEHGELAGLGTSTLPGSRAVCAPLRVGQARYGVLALLPPDRAALTADQRAFLDIFCRQMAAAFERAALATEARASALRARTEEMRSSLLSSVSHDLRTPLATITGAAAVLRDEGSLTASTRGELVDSICTEAERLERLVTNLLEMTRLASGAVALRRDWVPLDEVVGSVLTRLEKRLAQHEVTVEMPHEVPFVFVDPVVIEELFVNVLDNAAKYATPACSVTIRARRVGESVTVEIADRGPGLEPGTEERVFDQFYRGTHVGPAGAGLGLAICRGIAEAHGGTIRAENAPAGGAVFTVTLPTGGEPPPVVRVEGGDP